MIKVEVIEDFNLGKFNELKNIQRRNLDTYGRLYEGDIFECTQPMAEYLTGENALKKPFVKVIEVIPKIKKEEPEEKRQIEIKKEIKPRKKRTSKKKD